MNRASGYMTSHRGIRPCAELTAAMLLLTLASWPAGATESGGRVSFGGEVVDTPCLLAPGQDGLDINVDFGTVSIHGFNRGEVKTKGFVINLKDCDLAGKTATLTFNSAQMIDYDPEYLRASYFHDTSAPGGGNAQDAKLYLSLEGGGQPGRWTFGVPRPLDGLTDGDNALTFTATLQSLNGEAVNVGTGRIAASADFVITYS